MLDSKLNLAWPRNRRESVPSWKIALAILLWLGIFAAVWLLCTWSDRAFSHSWYDPECCSDRDCHPVDSRELAEAADGTWIYLPTGARFERSKIRPSRDARFHICVLESTGASLCLYVIQGS